MSTVCTLHRAVGGAEHCPGESCSFWSSAEGRCVLARLEGALLTETELARHLLALRAELDAARDAERADARSLFFQRLNRAASPPDPTGPPHPTG
ncbi:MAG: hypothetical protein K0T00_1024 [Gaiellaceae bacterium]|nr:hypothetical protein [Gaiellaceae bacterium]